MNCDARQSSRSFRSGKGRQPAIRPERPKFGEIVQGVLGSRIGMQLRCEYLKILQHFLSIRVSLLGIFGNRSADDLRKRKLAPQQEGQHLTIEPHAILSSRHFRYARSHFPQYDPDGIEIVAGQNWLWLRVVPLVSADSRFPQEANEPGIGQHPTAANAKDVARRNVSMEEARVMERQQGPDDADPN